MARDDLIIIGGGVIGCAVAWRAAQRGHSVTLLECDRIGAGATHAAAGMLAPIAEADYGEAAQQLLTLGLQAAEAWPAFAAELEAASGVPSTLRDGGTLLLARDRDDAEALERELAHAQGLGLEIARLLPSEARRLEPGLAPLLRAAAQIPSESSVDPRAVCAALAVAARAAGATLRERARVAALARGDGRVSGVVLEDGSVLYAEHVVVAAGAWSGRFGAGGIRPVKGQVMRLRDPAGAGWLTRIVRFPGGYIVPRADGGYVLGASVEERGFDVGVTAGPIYELLRDAGELLPGLLEWELTEVSAGLRPGSPDNLPLIGRAAEPGLIWATGHYRNGILLAPVTAALVLDAIDGLAGVAALDPARHAAAPLTEGALA